MRFTTQKAPKAYVSNLTRGVSTDVKLILLPTPTQAPANHREKNDVMAKGSRSSEVEPLPALSHQLRTYVASASRKPTEERTTPSRSRPGPGPIEIDELARASARRTFP